MQASFMIAFLLLIIAGTAFWLWALVDVVRRPESSYRRGSRLVWALVIALTHSIGALVYVIAGRPREVRS